MTKQETIKVLQTIEDRAVDFPYMTACDWVAIAAAKRHLENSIEVKEVELMIHTIISECCDWLAMNTNLSHDEIEGCRNLMLTVKEEQLKAQKG